MFPHFHFSHYHFPSFVIAESPPAYASSYGRNHAAKAHGTGGCLLDDFISLTSSVPSPSGTDLVS